MSDWVIDRRSDARAPDPDDAGSAPVMSSVATEAAAPLAASARRAPAGTLSKDGRVGDTPDFGVLSAEGESKGGPGTVSSGVGDPGGVSYGLYQLATNRGQPQAFLKSAQGAPWAAQFGDFQPGAPEFSQVWRRIAQSDPAFAVAQYDFAKASYYQPQLDLIKRKTGLDLSGRSTALQNVIWSTGVQGPNTMAIVNALGRIRASPTSPNDDGALIDAIYAERSRKDASGALIYFRSSSAAVQRGVAARLSRERVQAQRMLAAERQP